MRGLKEEGQEELEQHLEAGKAAGTSCKTFQGSLHLLPISDYIFLIMSRLG